MYAQNKEKGKVKQKIVVSFQKKLEKTPFFSSFSPIVVDTIDGGVNTKEIKKGNFFLVLFAPDSRVQKKTFYIYYKATSAQARLPAELKHITKRRKRN